MCVSIPRISGYAGQRARKGGPGISETFAEFSTDFRRCLRQRKCFSSKARKTLTRAQTLASRPPLLARRAHGERNSQINCAGNELLSFRMQTMRDANTRAE